MVMRLSGNGLKMRLMRSWQARDTGLSAGSLQGMQSMRGRFCIRARPHNKHHHHTCVPQLHPESQKVAGLPYCLRCSCKNNSVEPCTMIISPNSEKNGRTKGLLTNYWENPQNRPFQAELHWKTLAAQIRFSTKPSHEWVHEAVE